MRILLAALSLAVATAAATATAGADDLFTVRGVPIDATADNALEAQTAAMREGQYAAARRMIERLTLPEDRVGTPLDSSTPLAGSDVSAMIAGFEIADEQRSATRYLGELDVAFDPGSVRRVLNTYDVPFVEAQARTRLVLPVYGSDAGLFLWEENPWGNAWADSNFSHNLTPMITPNEAMGGMGLVSARDALELNEPALRELASLYGVSRLAILRAQQGADSRRYGGYMVDIAPDGSFAVESFGPRTVSSTWAEAARSFVLEQERVWKEDNIVRDRTVTEIRVTVLYSGLPEWRSLQQALAGATLISNARLDAMSRDGALMTVSYRGGRDQLASELAERGAALEEQPGLGWVVLATR